MNIKTAVSVAACVIGLSTATQAATLDFVVDGGASSVTLTKTGGSCGFFRPCGVTADLAGGLDGTSFSLDAGDTSDDFDFLEFSTFGYGGGLLSYDITATLAFSSPNFAVTGDGTAGAILAFGSIVGGNLNWDAMGPITLNDGSVVDVTFADGTGFFLGSSATTTASVSAVSVAAVPLPASALFLLAGVGGLAAMRRRKAAA